MKVMIVNTLYAPYKIGGAEKSVQLLAEGLVRAGDDVWVVTLHESTGDQRTSHNGVMIHRLPLDNIYWPYGSPDDVPGSAHRLMWHARNTWNFAAAARFRRVLDEVRPDVVHCNVITGFSVAIWPEVKRRNIPLVQTLRDYGLMCSRSSMFKQGRNCRRRCIECRMLTLPGKYASRQVDQMVSNSNYVIRSHRQHGYFAHVPARRIFNMVDLPDAPRVAASRSGEPLVFGFIGRIESEKGIEVVLAACAGVRRSEWRLRIGGVGKTDYVDGLKQRFADPRIEWLDFVDSKSFYASIDVLLVSSIWPEPLPRTLIEALGAGLATICSDAGGIPEIAELGRYNINYAADDHLALAEAMAQAIDHADDWRQGGLTDENALSNFAEGRVIEQYRQVYRDATGREVAKPSQAPLSASIA